MTMATQIARALSGLGSLGLSAAMGLFGRSIPAEALYNVQCCHLVYPPSNWNNCYAHQFYTWACYNGFHCACCEAPGASAVWCPA
jgi:hypothetical protein